MTPEVVTYRSVRPQDFDAMHALVSFWDVTRNLGSWPWPPEPEFTRRRCQPFEGDGFVWAICLKDTLIGTVSVVRGELGYMLHPDHHGQGIITKAVHAALLHAFHDFCVGEVHADIWADNAASKHILTKFGFTLSVQEVEHALARDEPTESETYVLSRHTWLSRNPPRLTTWRLILRPLLHSDADAVVRVAGDYEVAKWTIPIPHPYCHADFDTYFAQVSVGDMGYVWAIEHDQYWIGMIGVGPALGYYLDPQFWGKGFMTEAAKAVVEFWFSETQADELRSSVFVENKASEAILRKLGFERIGSAQVYSFARAQEVAKHRMSLPRERWTFLRTGDDCDTASETGVRQSP
ncbi:MAG: GNAT family N-acetyltransferase [Pseudomonadota bacterium]